MTTAALAAAASAPLSFAAAASTSSGDGPLKTVQIEGHVLLKILKHCAECAPALVTGQLLGLDVGTTLEVTEAFPFPVRKLIDGVGRRSNERLTLRFYLFWLSRRGLLQVLVVSLCSSSSKDAIRSHPRTEIQSEQARNESGNAPLTKESQREKKPPLCSSRSPFLVLQLTSPLSFFKTPTSTTKPTNQPTSPAPTTAPPPPPAPPMTRTRMTGEPPTSST